MERNNSRRTAWCAGMVLILLLAPALGFAQVLPLYDAVNKTVANYPLLHQRQTEIAAGKAHINTVLGNRLPSLVLQDQLNIATNNSLQGSYLAMGMIPAASGNNNSPNQNNSPNANNVALSYLQWEFYNFGYYGAQKKLAQAQLGVLEANLSSDRYTLTEQIVGLYLNWLKKYRLLQIQNNNLRRAQVVLTAIRATVMSGLKPGVDSSTASAIYADARLAYLQAQNDYNNDRIAIASYTGQRAENLAPDTTLGMAAFTASTLPQTDSVTANHPLLNVYQRQYEQQQAELNATSKKYMPRLAMNGIAWQRNSGISYTGVYPDNWWSGIGYSKYNYLLGLSLTYNLFDIKHRHDQLNEDRYMAEAKLNTLQNQQVNLQRMEAQANATYGVTVEKLKEMPVLLGSARQAYEQQMALYRAGLNTLVDVTNAQYTLLLAETNYVNTQDELLQLTFIRAGLGGQLDNFLQILNR